VPPSAAILFGLSAAANGHSVVATGLITDPKMRLLQGDTARVIIPGLLAHPQIEIARSSQSGTEVPVGSAVEVSLPKSTINLSADQEKRLESIVETIKGAVKQ
jgi:hypothetical protein